MHFKTPGIIGSTSDDGVDIPKAAIVDVFIFHEGIVDHTPLFALYVTNEPNRESLITNEIGIDSHFPPENLLHPAHLILKRTDNANRAFVAPGDDLFDVPFDGFYLVEIDPPA